MSFFLFIKRLFKKSEELSIENDNEIRFNRYIDLIENNVMGYNKAKVAGYLIALIVEYLNNCEAINSLEYEHTSPDNSLIEQIYKKIENDLSLDKRFSKFDEIHLEKVKTIEINSIPIILNPWNGGRIVDNLMSIGENGNIFNGIAHKINIQNHYLYPMDVIVCNGGNHSQFSARFKNEGQTVIDTIYDFSALYNEVSFNGRNYIRKQDSSILELTFDEVLIFYSGVIFELGRYLYNSRYNRFQLNNNL